MIEKILVGIDGSENSYKALNYAIDLAQKYNASLIILNILQIPVFGTPQEPLEVSAATTSIINDLRKTHENTLNKAKEIAQKTNPKIKINAIMKEGNPASQITSTADEEKADLIVIGHTGQGRLKELFLGTTSERVAHTAKCAVLIIK